MDAPLYKPATTFVASTVQPYPLTVEGCTLAELMAIPAAWAIVTRHLPSMKVIATLPVAKPQIGIMTVADFGFFSGRRDTSAYVVINKELASLPARGDAR